MTDAEIDTSDIPPLDETFFANATLRLPKSVSVEVDAEVIAWFRQHGQNHRKQINTILKSYISLQEQLATV